MYDITNGFTALAPDAISLCTKKYIQVGDTRRLYHERNVSPVSYDLYSHQT